MYDLRTMFTGISRSTWADAQASPLRRANRITANNAIKIKRQRKRQGTHIGGMNNWEFTLRSVSDVCIMGKHCVSGSFQLQPMPDR